MNYGNITNYDYQDEDRLKYEIVNTPEIFEKVVRQVAEHFGANPTAPDLRHFAKIIENTNYERYCGYPATSAVPYTVNAIIAKITKINNTPDIDISKLLRGEETIEENEISVDRSRIEPFEQKKIFNAENQRIWRHYEDAILNQYIRAPVNETTVKFSRNTRPGEVFISPESMYALANVINRKSLWRTQRAFIDSRYRKTDTDGREFISFDVSDSNNLADENFGTVFIRNGLKDVVSVQIPPFSIPYTASADNQLKKIYILISEFEPQATFAKKFQYHFECDVEVVNNRIKLTPLFDGVCEFLTPITIADTLNFRFYAPNPVIFDSDRLPVSVSHTNPGEFTTSTPHNLSTGDLVYFNNFTSNAPVADKNIINEVNQEQGHTITKTSNTKFTIPVDLTAISSADTGQTPDAIFGSKLIQFSILFSTMVRTTLIGGLEDDE